MRHTLPAAAALVALALGAGPARDAGLPWERLSNPVLQYPDWSIKDAAIAESGGTFYFFFSAFYEDRGRVRSHVVEVSTKDLKTFSAPILNLAGAEEGWIGMASPDVFHDGSRWIVTYNSWGDHPEKANQLFYRTSPDLLHWSPQRPLAANLTAGKRAIDATLQRSALGYHLIYKEVQTTRAAFSARLDGPFRFAGDGLPRFNRNGVAATWHENCQLLRIDGRWHMLTTSDDKHLPFLYRMRGDGSRVEDWLEWIEGRQLRMPGEGFNTYHEANAAALLDRRARDGYFYLLYAGTTEGDTYLGRGWNRLGLARSKDLTRWSPAGH